MKNWYATVSVALVLAFPLSLGAFYLGSYERQARADLSTKEVEGWIQQHAKRIEASDVAILQARAEVLKHEEFRQKLINDAKNLQGRLDAMTEKVVSPRTPGSETSASVSPLSNSSEAEAAAKLDIEKVATQKSLFGPARFVPFERFISEGNVNMNNLGELVKNIDFSRGNPQIYVAGMKKTTEDLRKLRAALKPVGVDILRSTAIPSDVATVIVPEHYLR